MTTEFRLEEYSVDPGLTREEITKVILNRTISEVRLSEITWSKVVEVMVVKYNFCKDWLLLLTPELEKHLKPCDFATLTNEQIKLMINVAPDEVRKRITDSIMMFNCVMLSECFPTDNLIVLAARKIMLEILARASWRDYKSVTQSN